MTSDRASLRGIRIGRSTARASEKTCKADGRRENGAGAGDRARGERRRLPRARTKVCFEIVSRSLRDRSIYHRRAARRRDPRSRTLDSIRLDSTRLDSRSRSRGTKGCETRIILGGSRKRDATLREGRTSHVDLFLLDVVVIVVVVALPRGDSTAEISAIGRGESRVDRRTQRTHVMSTSYLLVSLLIVAWQSGAQANWW